MLLPGLLLLPHLHIKLLQQLPSQVLFLFDKSATLLVCYVLQLAPLKLVLQVQLLDLFLLGEQLIIHPSFKLHHGLCQHPQLLMILPLHLLLDALQQPFQLLSLPLDLLSALLPQLPQLGVEVRVLLSDTSQVKLEGVLF